MQANDFKSFSDVYSIVSATNKELDRFRENMEKFDADSSLFYTTKDIQKITGWSKRTVENLFNNPAFPSTNIGKQKLVLKTSFIEFFSVRRDKADEKYWR